MDLLLQYMIAGPSYANTKFRYFKGVTGGPGDVVNPPVDTGLTFMSAAGDVLVFSFMHGGAPYALACVVTTNFSTGRSTGRYFVCKPTINGSDIAWTLVTDGANGITLKAMINLQLVEVAGNPHGVAQAGANLGIVDYDDDGVDEDGYPIINIYTLDISALVGKTSGGDFTVTATLIPTANLPGPEGPLPAGTTFEVHGNGLIALTDTSGNTFYYAQFNGVIEDADHMPVDYVNSTVVRLLSSDLEQQSPVTVGKNAMGMVPLPIPAPGGTVSGIALAVPCYGGVYRYGATNGVDSCLYRINDIFAATMTAAAAIIGDGNVGAVLTAEGTRDFKSVTFSDDGLFGYVLAVTYNSSGKACWKLYQTTAANILGSTNMSFSTAIDKNLLVLIDGSIELVGEDGADWEVLYENATPSRNGRLWLVKGTTFQVSQGSLYSNSKLFDPEDVYGDNTPGYINSADLIREMIYQYNKGHSIETRLIKGKTVAKIARAAAASAAPEEDDDK